MTSLNLTHLIIREGGDISEFGLWLAGMIAVGMLIAAVVTGAAW